ncbi:MAG: 3-hydroxyacyl-CoA dehydrogenase NAD-binding domain-containing protein [Bdellovibrionaceae bacterium]|nr:3-hydroxyacyl-CoA dehydrogenase NAD-binding domain-containing protein [Pseudobdellovibrionaceae bacterium]
MSMEESLKLVSKGEYVVLELDLQGEKVNKLSTPVMLRLEKLLEEVKSSSYKALVILSKKKNIFIAGADIEEIKSFTDKDAFSEAVERGQNIMNHIEDLKIPVIAAINGACMGGGTELALACDYRVASDADSTKIGLPETQLGIIPGFGGCVRLPRVVGLIQSLQIILPGGSVRADKAYKIGLVDEVIPETVFESKVEEFVNAILKKGAKKRRKVFSPSLTGKLMESPLLKWKIFSESKKGIMKQSKGHYPAPLKALEVVQKTYGMSNRTKALRIEREGFLEVALTDISKNLIQLFFWMENIKKRNGLPAGAPAVKPREIKNMAVLGAGTMGGGIAQLAADKGVNVRMKDLSNEALKKGFEAAADIWNKKVKRRRMTEKELQTKMGHLTGTMDYSGFQHMDLVVEAIVEDMNIKKKVIAETVAQCPKDCIIATNTSSLSVNEMSEAHPRPENFVGLHYFNPVHKMPLVEVIRGKNTSDEVTTTVFEFAKRMGKTPVVVNDGPGFLVNRLLLPWLSEALFILEDGMDIKTVDKYYTHIFGMPMGPYRLMDEIGIDVCMKVLKIFKSSFGDRMEVSKLVEKVSQTDRLGRKNKKGFYKYDEKGFATEVDTSVYADLGLPAPKANIPAGEVIDRGVYAMVNEAALALLEDKIVESAEEVDVAMIFGTGFPPFRGGLLKYADSVGVKNVVERLEAFESKYSSRFKPTEPLRELVNNNKTFY